MLNVRPAGEGDADLLLIWANDPVTRQNSFNKNPIERADHIRWYEGRLKDPNVRIYIFSDGKDDVGVVHLNREGDTTEVHFTVAPAARGRGLGKKMIEAAKELARDAFPGTLLIARVLPDNTGSVKIFRSRGFSEAGKDVVKGQQCLRFEWRNND